MKISVDKSRDVVDLKEALKLWKPGQRIQLCHYDGKPQDLNWFPHERGVIIDAEGRLLLNGEDVLFEGPDAQAGPHLSGFWVENEDGFISVNGRQVLSISVDEPWYPYLEGALVDIDGRLMLNRNNKKIIYQKTEDYDSYVITQCVCHQGGLLVCEREEVWTGYKDIEIETIYFCRDHTTSKIMETDDDFRMFAPHPKGVAILDRTSDYNTLSIVSLRGKVVSKESSQSRLPSSD